MTQEWFADLYDEFRMRTGFGSVSEEQTGKKVDFLWDVLSLASGSKVLDLFCGAGRHSMELTRRGCITTGIELNARYVETARKNAPMPAQFVLGDVRHVDFGSGFDACIIMFHSFGYFADVEERLVLKKVHDALRTGGRFLIEILNRDWLLANFRERAEKVVDDVKVVETRRFDVLSSRNHFRIERYSATGTIVKEGAWRLYSPHEMKNLLEGIGFRFLQAYSSLAKEPLTKDTRLMRLLFQRM
ncbi:MAG TPA: class I SAM-dependent methyltransferase [Candidatus Angelobacter sp.]